MRTFYIFKIKKHYALLTNNNPYLLYKTLENMYKAQTPQIEKSVFFFNQITNPFLEERINTNLYHLYKEKNNYSKYKNNHFILDYKTEEKSKLVVSHKYLIIQSNSEVPIFLRTMHDRNSNLFVCDFNEKDYFWLHQLYG